MKTSRIAVGLALAVVVAMVGGCAGLGKGESDQKLVAKAVDDWAAAMKAKDVPKILALTSEDFKGEQGGKAQLGEGMKGFIEQGYLDSLEVDLSRAKTTIEAGAATVAAIGLSSSAGSVTVDLKLKKDADKAWRVVGLDNY